MSVAAIRAALEKQLAATVGALPVAWENVEFTPVVGQAYAQAFVLLAAPENIEIGPGFTDRGVFQVNLLFPLGDGPALATAKAEAIRSAFPYRASLVSGGTTVNIIATPEIGPARAEDDRYFLPVKVRFQARIGG